MPWFTRTLLIVSLPDLQIGSTTFNDGDTGVGPHYYDFSFVVAALGTRAGCTQHVLQAVRTASGIIDAYDI